MAISETNAISPRLVLFLYKVAPTCVVVDNSANDAPVHADNANLIGLIEFPAMTSVKTGDSYAIASPSTYGNLPLWVDATTNADDILGVLATLDIFTNTAGNEMTITLSMAY